MLQLAEQAVGCSLHGAWEQRESARRAAARLIVRINEKQLSVADLLLLFARQQGQLDEMRGVLSRGKVDLDLDFEVNRDVLTVTASGDGVFVRLTFPPGPCRGDGAHPEPYYTGAEHSTAHKKGNNVIRDL